MENKIQVNIIGSGIGGLFAGALLAKHGFKVNVFEARVEIGGYCSSWKRGDYTFESSLHELNGFYPDDKRLRSFRFLGLFDKLKFLKVPSSYTSVFKDMDFRMPHGFEELKKKLSEDFPDEKNEISQLLDELKLISETAFLFSHEKSQVKAFFKVPKKFPALMKHSFSSVYSFIWKKLKNPKLRTILAQLYLYYADNINKLNLLYFACPTYTFFGGESYWISGSSRNLVEALRDTIIENGGSVQTRKKVTKIIFENKKAVGIEVNDNEKYYSDLTICNTPINDTFERLIDKKDFGGFFRHRALHIVPSTSIFCMYIGLKIEARDINIKEYCYIFNEVDDLKDVAWKNKTVIHQNRPLVMTTYLLDKSLTPPGKTVLNICIPDKEEYWEKYKDNKEEYKAEKKRIADLLIDKIDRKFPGFRENIEVLEIGTPLTMKKFSNNNAGAVYGAAQETSQTNLLRFPNEFKKKNLYFSSAWATPGGGVCGAMLSAIFVTEKILNRYAIPNLMDDYQHPLPLPNTDNRPENHETK